MSTLKKILLAIFVLLLALLAYWLVFVLTWEDVATDTGFTAKARSSPFLAATQFLAGQGIVAEEKRGLALLDDLTTAETTVGPHDTLVLVESFNALAPERIDKLWGWIDAGGTVFYSTRNFLQRNPLDDPKGLLSGLGMAVARTDSAANSYEVYEKRASKRDKVTKRGDNTNLDDMLKELAGGSGETQCEKDLVPTDVIVDAASPTARVQFFGDRKLLMPKDRADMTSIAEDARGVQLASITYGDGHVYVGTDEQIWSNRRLSCFDHAWLLWNISKGNKVWFLRNYDSASLGSLIWGVSPAGCVLLLLALALALHTATRRFGPVRQVDTGSRRNFFDHVQASASLNWHGNHCRHLLLSLQQEILRLQTQRRPGFSATPIEQQVSHFCQQTGLSALQIHQALYEPLAAKIKKDSFVGKVRLLQQIHSQLLGTRHDG